MWFPVRGRRRRTRRHPAQCAARRRVAPRVQRRLVASLRRTAARAGTPPAPGRRRELLLVHRAGAVRADLLALASAIEHTPEPDPEAVRTLLRLLTDGCDSPLYNERIHPSELLATLYYARRRICPPEAGAAIRPSAPWG
jgi:hypothetical protein